jgi:hypothetical protein
MPLRRTATYSLPLASCLLLLATASNGIASRSGAKAAQAIVLSQRIGPGGGLQLTISDQGTNAVELRDGKAIAGASVNYEDKTLLTLNYRTKSYSTQPIADAVRNLARDRKLMLKAHAEVSFKPPLARLLIPATVKRTDLTATIADQPAQAYLVNQNGEQQRIWVATKLPEAPADVQKLVGNFVNIPSQAGGVVLRADVQVKGKWLTALTTTASKTVDLPANPFTPPAGWKRRAPQSQRTPAFTPATVRRGSGPIMPRPDVFSLYWGGPFPGFSFRTPMDSFVSSLVGVPAPSAFWLPLAQYGVARGGFLGSAPTPFPLIPDVGCYNVPLVWHMIEFAYFTTGAPKIWWQPFVGARDPLLAIFIPSSAVASCGWTGYHFFAPSPAWLIPWPISLAAHPMMPFLIVKAPPNAAKTGLSLAGSTIDATHELVETVADPLPLSANIDPAMFPQWANGEISDICSIGTTAAQMTGFKFGFTVSRYWSNTAGACVG